MTTKRKTRPDQEGSIYYSEQRQKWVAQYTVGYNPKNGRRIYRYKIAATRKEAAKKLDELKRKYLSVQSIDAEHMTTEAWLLEWFHTYSEPKVRANTQSNYLSTIKTISASVGSIPLDKLTPRDLQNLLFKDLREKYTTAVHTRQLLKQAFTKAVKLRLLPENPAADLELPPRPPKREFVKPSHKDWQKLLSAKTSYRGWRLIMLTEYVTGARISELLALKWEDISVLVSTGSTEKWQRLDEGAITGTIIKGRLHIGHALIAGKNSKKGGPVPLYRTATKTRNSDRHLPLPADYCKELLAYRHKEFETRLMFGDTWHDEGYIFTKWDGSPLPPYNFSSYFSTLRRKLGVGSTFHMLRHDMASRMKGSRRFDLKDVQAQLGHSTIQITMDIYTHIDDAQKENVKDWLQDDMEKLLAPKQK